MIKRSSLFFLLFVSSVLVSCSGSGTAGISFSANRYYIQPGLTADAELTVYFNEGKPADSAGDILQEGALDLRDLPEDISLKPAKKDLKAFSAAPDIMISDPGLRILNIKQNSSVDGISAVITFIASETLLSGKKTVINAQWGNLSARTELAVRKDPRKYINTDGVITDAGAFDELINKQRRLPADYIPSDLVRVGVPTILSFDEVNQLRAPASAALSEMFSAAQTEKGFELLARSGYRSYKTQVSLFELNVREYGLEYARRISARPGTSEHQSGLAMDISSPVVNYQLNQDFGKTDEGIWVAGNAHRFGFIIRYPEDKEDMTGYTYEPWHLRWVGKDMAEEIYRRGICLEEYFTF